MRHHGTILGSLLLSTTALACGPAVGSDDGMIEPRTCFFGDQELEHGEQFDSPEGCVTYECNDGVLDVADDRRATLAGNLELTTQQMVDEQICLGQVEGNLRISGSAADLTPLGRLYRVSGNLEIDASEAQTLTGLEAINEVGGAVLVRDNASLEQLAFNYSMSVFGDVTIQNNDRLVSLAGAEFIGACGACAGVVGGARDLVGDEEPAAASGGAPAGDEGGLDEPGGGTFYGNLLIADNDVLTDIYAMSNLFYAWADVRFRNNAMLTSLGALTLQQVRGDLEIADHPQMTTADAQSLADRVVVDGTITICGTSDGEPCM